MDFFYLDIETTSLDPSNGKVIEFALLADSQKDIAAKSSLLSLPRLNIMSMPRFIMGDFTAVQMNWDKLVYMNDLKKLTKDWSVPSLVCSKGRIWDLVNPIQYKPFYKSGYNYFVQTLEDAAPIINDFITECIGPEEKVRLCGKNASMFDLPFLKAHYMVGGLWDFELTDWNQELVVRRIAHRVLDVGSVFFRPGIDKWVPNTTECCERAGIDGSVHDALGDCLICAALLRSQVPNE